jgi:hypothetical protein
MMTLKVDRPEEKTAALWAKARARGLSTEEYALRIIEKDLVQDPVPAWLVESWATSQEAGLAQLSMDEIDEEIQAARKLRRDSRPQPGS